MNVGNLVVDPNLTDERGFNADLGIRGNWENLFNFDLSLFHLAYRDRIGSILRKEPNPVFNNLVDRVIRFRTNVADASIYGLSLLRSSMYLDYWARKTTAVDYLFSPTWPSFQQPMRMLGSAALKAMKWSWFLISM